MINKKKTSAVSRGHVKRTPFVIFGAGGHAREMRTVVDACILDGEPWEFVGWATDDSSLGTTLDDMPIARWDYWRKYRPHVLIAIGAPQGRKQIARRLAADTVSFPSVVHPDVRIGPRVSLGVGTQVAAGCVLTVDVVIGDFVLLNRSVQLSHDDVLADFVTLSPMVSFAGNVKVKEGADFGTGAIAIPGVCIGAWSVVGAGSVLIRDVADNAVVVGNPAREIKRNVPSSI